MKRMQWINTAALGSMLLVNLLANLIPIGGRTTGEISAMYPSLITPAPLTFGIWGIIYALMTLFVVYQWEVFDNGQKSAQVRAAVGPWFAVSCLFNSVWLFCWHLGSITLALCAIAALLVSLLLIELLLDEFSFKWKDWFLAKAGFDVCFGWIVAATLANLGTLMVKAGWSGWGASSELWTMLMLMGGALITCLLVLYSSMPVAALSVLWAYSGILVRHFSQGGYAGNYPFVITGAIIGITAIVSAYAIRFYQMIKDKKAMAVMR